MNCFNDNDAMLAALGLVGNREHNHLAGCSACRAKVQSLTPLIERIAAAHGWFDRGHAEHRQRLLATLAAEPQSVAATSNRQVGRTTAELNGRAPLTLAAPCAESKFPFHHSLGELCMRHRIALSSVGLAAAVLWAGWLLLATRPLSAMEQVAAKVRAATSFSFEMSSEFGGKVAPGTGKLYWKAPGTIRLEEPMLPDGNLVVSIFPHDEQGIRIDETHRIYALLAARRGYTSPLMLAWKLGSFSGEADKELGKREIGGRDAIGFQIAAEKVDPDVRGVLEIWVDAKTHLPALVEYEMGQPPAKMIMKQFEWNVPLAASLFDVAPPEGFADKTPQPPTLEENVQAITEAFQTYSEICGGHYPRVKMVYGDVTIGEMKQQAGIERDMPTAAQREVYTKILQATHGFAATNGILRDNSDAAYHGKIVGPADKEKVLLRWKLDSDEYEVIYGDLRSETVSAEQLKKLEAK
jgi:outer membrane lipoprotein-sorting protein